MRLEFDRAIVAAVAILTASAGVIHMAMVPMHADHRFSMALFLVGGLAQLGLVAFLAFGDRRRALVASAVVNGGAASLWALTRATGVGFLPGFEARQHIEAADVAATAFEIAAMAAAFVALRLTHNSVPGRVMPAFGCACAVVLAAALAVPSDHSGHAHGGTDGHHGHHAVGVHPHVDDGHHDVAGTGGHEHGGDHEHAAAMEHAEHDAHAHATGAHPRHDEAHADGSHVHDEGSHTDHTDHTDHGHAPPPGAEDDPDAAPSDGTTDEPSDLNKVCTWYAPPASEYCP